MRVVSYRKSRQRTLVSRALSCTVQTAMNGDPHCHSVLVVEDDLDSREAMKEYLRLEGFRVAAADDGEAALSTLRAGFAPCVILLDVHMPGLDGQAFERERLREPTLAKVPVIVISGDERLCYDGAIGSVEHVLMKPVHLPTLRTTIQRVCSA
jgi:CheY-like chemotaxis protein